MRNKPEAAPLVAKFRAKNYEPEGITFPTYIAVQVWAAAVEKAGTLELDPVIKTLQTNQFDTLLGRIGFDAKGDVTGYEPFVWYVWKGGHYRAAGPGEADRVRQRCSPEQANFGDDVGKTREVGSYQPNPCGDLERKPSFSAPFAHEALLQRTLWDGIGGALRCSGHSRRSTASPGKNSFYQKGDITLQGL